MYLQTSAVDSSIVPTEDYTKSTSQVYVQLVRHRIKSTNSIDVICRYWTLKPMDKTLEDIPSWIGLVDNSPFGSFLRAQKATGWLNGDSLVGKPGRKVCNASRGLCAMWTLDVDDLPEFCWLTNKLYETGSYLACIACRLSKERCSGERPRCDKCLTRPCVYQGNFIRLISPSTPKSKTT